LPGVLENAAELVAGAQPAIQMAENTLNVRKPRKSKQRPSPFDLTCGDRATVFCENESNSKSKP